MKNILPFLFLFLSFNLKSQDTFSIVAVDSITGEVGSAGASCVDLIPFPQYTTHFLGELFPGVGAINTQASYEPGNQTRARNRMNAGDFPEDIIDYMVANDIGNDPSIRQYGVVKVDGGKAYSAAHTGSGTLSYANHITGPGYSIQGNILLGQQVLDSMEARFLREKGSLHCKLMAALQGAKVVGADTRCAPNGSSSLFAFVKVAQPTDDFGDPSFVIGVKTRDGDGIEPIDSLYSIYKNMEEHCTLVGVDEVNSKPSKRRLYPNPTYGKLIITSNQKIIEAKVLSADGKLVKTIPEMKGNAISTKSLPKGSFVIQWKEGDVWLSAPFTKE